MKKTIYAILLLSISFSTFAIFPQVEYAGALRNTLRTCDGVTDESFKSLLELQEKFLCETYSDMEAFCDCVEERDIDPSPLSFGKAKEKIILNAFEDEIVNFIAMAMYIGKKELVSSQNGCRDILPGLPPNMREKIYKRNSELEFDERGVPLYVTFNKVQSQTVLLFDTISSSAVKLVQKKNIGWLNSFLSGQCSMVKAIFSNNDFHNFLDNVSGLSAYANDAWVKKEFNNYLSGVFNNDDSKGLFGSSNIFDNLNAMEKAELQSRLCSKYGIDKLENSNRRRRQKQARSRAKAFDDLPYSHADSFVTASMSSGMFGKIGSMPGNDAKELMTATSAVVDIKTDSAAVVIDQARPFNSKESIKPAGKVKQSEDFSNQQERFEKQKRQKFSTKFWTGLNKYMSKNKDKVIKELPKNEKALERELVTRLLNIDQICVNESVQCLETVAQLRIIQKHREDRILQGLKDELAAAEKKGMSKEEMEKFMDDYEMKIITLMQKKESEKSLFDSTVAAQCELYTYALACEEPKFTSANLGLSAFKLKEYYNSISDKFSSKTVEATEVDMGDYYKDINKKDEQMQAALIRMNANGASVNDMLKLANADSGSSTMKSILAKNNIVMADLGKPITNNVSRNDYESAKPNAVNSIIKNNSSKMPKSNLSNVVQPANNNSQLSAQYQSTGFTNPNLTQTNATNIQNSLVANNTFNDLMDSKTRKTYRNSAKKEGRYLNEIERLRKLLADKDEKEELADPELIELEDEIARLKKEIEETSNELKDKEKEKKTQTKQSNNVVPKSVPNPIVRAPHIITRNNSSAFISAPKVSQGSNQGQAIQTNSFSNNSGQAAINYLPQLPAANEGGTAGNNVNTRLYDNRSNAVVADNVAQIVLQSKGAISQETLSNLNNVEISEQIRQNLNLNAGDDVLVLNDEGEYVVYRPELKEDGKTEYKKIKVLTKEEKDEIKKSSDKIVKDAEVNLLRQMKEGYEVRYRDLLNLLEKHK